VKGFRSSKQYEQAKRAVFISLVLAGLISLFMWASGSAGLLLRKGNAASTLHVSQGEEIPFTLSSVDPTSDDAYCTWDFGDGSPVVREANPAHVFEKCGTYTVTVTAPDAQGMDRETTFSVIVEGGGSRFGDNPGANSKWSTYWARQDQAVVTGYTSQGNDQSVELNKQQVTAKVEIRQDPDESRKQAVIIRALSRPAGIQTMQSELGAARHLLDLQVLRNPILKGTSIFIKDCPNNWQGCAFYELGIIWIDPDHKAPLEEIVVHECNHIIDWREDGDIDYDDS
jgi:hypothetical protein